MSVERIDAEVPYQPLFDFEMPNYKVLGAKLREMAHSYKYEDDPVLDDFDYVFDVSQAELELLNPVDSGMQPHPLPYLHAFTLSPLSTLIQGG